jgi:hypothetical protein
LQREPINCVRASPTRVDKITTLFSIHTPTDSLFSLNIILVWESERKRGRERVKEEKGQRKY